MPTLTEQIILKVKLDSKSAEAGMDRIIKKAKVTEGAIDNLGKSVKKFGEDSAGASKQVNLLGASIKSIGSKKVNLKVNSDAGQAATGLNNL